MRNTDAPLLRIDDLDVHYGQAHALQGISLALGDGVLAVVGRNGMGKSTLCKAITGMVPARGAIKFAGTQLLGLTPDRITHLGVAYVPQGRRVWRSLSVDETLRLSAKTARQGAWTVERIYEVFPRLAERRGNGGGQLSGGEQQMLAIGRALLFNPRLLVMDEPTEGLAPVIVEQVATLIKTLAADRSMSVLLIEQNLGVALEVADRVAIMVNGRIANELPAAELAADRALQQRLLGLKAGASEDAAAESIPSATAIDIRTPVLRVVRAFGPSSEIAGHDAPPVPTAIVVHPGPAPAARNVAGPYTQQSESTETEKAVYLVGAWSSQPRPLAYAKRCLEQCGARVVSVDLVDRGPMLSSYLVERSDLGAVLALVDEASAAIACAGVLSLPTGIPKLVLSDRPLPGTEADVLVMTAPLAEFNRVSQTLLAHAASAIAGMLRQSSALHGPGKPLVCITSLDLAAAAVRHTRRGLGDALDCIVLDMGKGGSETLARLARSGLIAGVIDLAPVDISRAIVTGDERSATARFDALIASGIPYVCVPALLGVVTFPSGQAVPATLLQRNVLSSALDGSIVPVSLGEAARVANWLADRINAFAGPVGLVSAKPSAIELRKLGGGHGAVELQQAIQLALHRRVKPGGGRQLVDHPESLSESRFGEAVAGLFRELLNDATKSHASAPSTTLIRSAPLTRMTS